MRLIDADALEKFLKRLRRDLPKESRDFFTRDEMILNFQQYVHMQPTIDAVPVVRGEWKPIFKGADTCECSVCKSEGFSDSDFGFIATPYCPNCGAEMEVKQDE